MTADPEFDDERPISRDDIEDWEVTAVGPARGPLSAVLTVRFTDEELRRIRDAARQRRVSMGDVVRQAVEDHFAPYRRMTTLVMGYTGAPGSANILARQGLVTFGGGQEEESLSQTG